MKRSNTKGFTLLELMVVLAVIGLLSAIAVPNYQSYMRKAARSSAQAELIELASIQEKIFLNSSAYALDVTTTYNGSKTGGLGRTSGKTNDGKYTLSLTPSAGTTYTLTATPVAGKAQAADGILSINDSGQRVWVPASGSTTW